jgi:hypothetical protein
VLAIDYSWPSGIDESPEAMDKLVNAVIDAIIGVSKHHGAHYHVTPIQIFPPYMVLIWSTLAKGRALRRLLINYYRDNVTAEALGPHLNECHPDFIKSLAMMSLGGGPFEGEASNALAACDEFKYHEHIDTQRDHCEGADFWTEELFNFEPT